MGTAFSCRENLEDKGVFCQIIVSAQIIILAHIIFMPQSKVLEKVYFAKNALFDG